jgi:hypothetical protein
MLDTRNLLKKRVFITQSHRPSFDADISQHAVIDISQSRNQNHNKQYNTEEIKD